MCDADVIKVSSLLKFNDLLDKCILVTYIMKSIKIFRT